MSWIAVDLEAEWADRHKDVNVNPDVRVIALLMREAPTGPTHALVVRDVYQGSRHQPSIVSVTEIVAFELLRLRRQR